MSKEFQAEMVKLREDAKTAVNADIARQVISPEEEAAKRAASVPSHVAPGQPIWLQIGKSRLLEFDHPIRRVSIGNPGLANIVVLGRHSLMINAEPPSGTTGGGPAGQAPYHAGSMTGAVATGLSISGESLQMTKPLTPQPHVAETTLVIWTDADGAERSDIHTLVVADFIDQQVMLEVTIAEVNRTSMEQHGVDFRILQNDFIAASFLGGGAGSTAGTIFPSVPLLPLTLGPEAPTYAFVLPNEDVTAFVRALQTEGLATILAQPKLLAMSGQSALFQSGGEIPIKISTGFASTVQFKPFGTLVNFVPRVSDEGDIMLTVTPEVSQPDFTMEVDGIPTFRTRRASTSTRLRNGQTLVIGGLMQTLRQEFVRGVPYFKDIPILGYIFRNTSYEDDVTELLIIVKPVLVHPMPAGVELPLPTDRGPLRNEDTETKPDPDSATRPRMP